MRYSYVVFIQAAFLLAVPFTSIAKEKAKPPSIAKDSYKTKYDELMAAMSKCSEQSLPFIRVKCFDNLVGGTPAKSAPKPDQTNKVNGKWKVTEETDPLTDVKSVFLSLAADTGSASMMIRCRNIETELFINWGQTLKKLVLGYSETPMLMRIGKEKADKTIWSVSVDGKATFASDAVPLIKKLITDDTTFSGQVNTSYEPYPVTATFDIKGLGSAIKPVAEACHWEQTPQGTNLK